MLSPVHIRPVLAIVVTVAVFGIAAVIYRSGFRELTPGKPVVKHPPHTIDIALKQARFSEIKNGLIVWELEAAQVEYDKSGGVAHLSGGIRINFSRNDARGSVVVTAEGGDYFSGSNTIALRNKVHVQSGDGATFETEALDYTAADSRFRTSGAVTCVQDRLTLRATGMELSVKEQRARFFSMIDATVRGISGTLSDKRQGKSK